MQYKAAAALALAIGASAVPYQHHRHHFSWPGYGGAAGSSSESAIAAYPTGGYAAPSTGFAGPTGGYAAPSETGIFSILPVSTTLTPVVEATAAPVNYSSGDDDDDDEEESSTKTTKSKTTKTKSSKTTSSESTATEDAEPTESVSSAESTDTASASSAESTESTESFSASSAAAATITSSSSSGSSGSSNSGGGIPASSGTSVLSAVQTIAAGESFDGGMVVFDRGVSCTGQSEGGDSDAVFELEDGASLSNVIIGPNQIEGIHCFGACKLTNVWWSAVCEDAFTIKEQAAGETTTITGGGAFGAEDKVLQHNGGGSLSVSGFTVDNFGKLYRSCGNCKTQYERHVIFDDITATEGKSLAGINSNYGDTATFSNVNVSGVDDICVDYQGTDNNDEEPSKVGSGPSDACIYSTSDITGS